MLAQTLRLGNVPSFGAGRSQLLSEQAVYKAKTADMGQAWMSMRDDGLVNLNLVGTCGPSCELAASVAGLMASHLDDAAENVAALDVGSGVSTFLTCLASNHGSKAAAASNHIRT